MDENANEEIIIPTQTQGFDAVRRFGLVIFMIFAVALVVAALLLR